TAGTVMLLRPTAASEVPWRLLIHLRATSGCAPAAPRTPAAVDPPDGPAGAVGLQQAGAHAGRDAGGGGVPRLVLPLQHRHGHRGADRAADGRRVQTTRSKNTELRSSSS